MMKFPASLLLCSCLCSVAWAEKAPNAAKSSALAELNKLEQGLTSSKTKRISAAAAALSLAAGSEEGALALFMKCKENEMKENGKKNGDFVDWKNKELRALTDKKSFKKALRLQCQWAYITLKKADADRQKRTIDVTPEVTSVIDSLMRDAKIFIGKDGDTLNGNEIGLIKKVLLITDIRPSSGWVDSVGNYDAIFDKILLEKQKERKNIEGFRSVWQKRIDMQQALTFSAETLDELKRKVAEKDQKRKESGVRVRDTKPEITAKDINLGDINPKHLEKLRDLYWRMEVECYQLGDEQKALPKLMGYLKDTKDPALQEAHIKELKDLILSKAGSSSPSVEKSPKPMEEEPSSYEEDTVEEVSVEESVPAASPQPTSVKKTPVRTMAAKSEFSDIPPTQEELAPAEESEPAPAKESPKPKAETQEDDSVWDV